MPSTIKNLSQGLPMAFWVRSSIISDYEWLLALHYDSYFDVIMRQFGHWDKDEQLEFFLNVWQSKNLSIMLINEQPAGMFLLEEHCDHLWLAELQIETTFQNQGIGSEAIRMLQKKSYKLGLPLRLRVLFENHRAKKLYLKYGFSDISMTEHHYVMESCSSKQNLTAH